MFSIRYGSHRTTKSFSDSPCLINKAYKHRTLAELISMYRRTGEFPMGVVRNGVYLGPDTPPLPNDKFDVIDGMERTIQDIEKAEDDLKKANEGIAAEKAAAEAAKAAEAAAEARLKKIIDKQ